MLKARPLSDLLAQTLSSSVDTALLFTKSGSLLAQASKPYDQRRSRVVAALAAGIWSKSDGADVAAGRTNTHRGEGWTCIDLENGRLFIQEVNVSGKEFGQLSEGLLIGIQGHQDALVGYLKLQATSIKEYLEAEFTRVSAPT